MNAKPNPINRLRSADVITERFVLGSIIDFPEMLAFAEGRLTHECFSTEQTKAVFAAVVALAARGEPVNICTLRRELEATGKLEGVGGMHAIASFGGMWSEPVLANEIAQLHDKALLREMMRTARGLAELDETADPMQTFRELFAGMQQLHERVTLSGDLSDLDRLRFDPAAPPPPERVIYRLGESVIATAGNVVGVCAQSKAGKTAFLGAAVASTMMPTGDTLGVSSSNEQGGAVIVFDSEQSSWHFHDCTTRALLRAGREMPRWLRAYRLKSRRVAERRRWLTAEMKRAAREHGAIHSVILDGIGDMVCDPNDSAESFGLIDELGALADQYQTAILAVLHENPGSEIGKTRGHLGSQLERKAESNLRLVKDADGVTVVFSERSRGAHIPKEKGTRFVWSDEAGMHVTTGARPKGRLRAFDPNEILELLRGEFVTYSEAFQRCEQEGWTATTFKRVWAELKKSGRIVESVMNRGEWGSKK